MVAYSHLSFAKMAQLKGDWDNCRNHCYRNLTLLAKHGKTHVHIMTIDCLVLTELQTGHADKAGEYLAKLIPLCPESSIPASYLVPKMALITGDASLLDRAEFELKKISDFTYPFNALTKFRQVGLAIIAFLKKDKETARSIYDFYLPWKGRHTEGGLRGESIDVLLGLLCTTLGNLDDALGHFEEALHFCRRAEHVVELAWAGYHCAETLILRRSRADAKRARNLLTESQELARNLGMAPLLAKIEKKLKQISLPASATNPGGLTRREMEVLLLITHGLTNREIGDKLFISTKTVNNHAVSIFAKTGMANRAEATAWAARNDLLDT